MSQGESVTREATCTGTDGVGLWQWISTDAEGLARAASIKTVCRYGPGMYNTSPKCPWSACADAQCETCYPDTFETSTPEIAQE